MNSRRERKKTMPSMAARRSASTSFGDLEAGGVAAGTSAWTASTWQLEVRVVVQQNVV